MLRFHTQTGGVTLTAQQPENNIVRVAPAGLRRRLRRHPVADTNGFDEALALPTERAAKIALRTQQIRPRVRRRRHRRSLRRSSTSSSRSPTVRTPRAGAGSARSTPSAARSTRSSSSPPRSTSPPGATRSATASARHRRRRQQVRGGRHRGPRPAARRSRVRARTGRPPDCLQGRPRPGDRAGSLEQPRGRPAAPTTCCRRSARR